MKEDIWFCKIGGIGCDLPGGADAPMRNAIADAFREVTGVEAQFIFSGWGQELTESERAVVENRAPSAEHYAKLKLEAAAPELLEAARAVVKENFGGPSGRMAKAKAWDALEAAIAKATQ
jgi:hypothetical protein